MLDFARLRNNEVTIAQLVSGLTVDDLHKLTDEMVDTELALIAGAVDADVTFAPIDPAANDTFASSTSDVNIAWTLGHVIVHSTASCEESAALAAELARGIEIKGRSRYETPWETVQTAKQLYSRLEECRRICHAYLNAWPELPNLNMTFTFQRPGASPVNAIGRFVYGLMHGEAHLAQIAEIMRQAKVAR